MAGLGLALVSLFEWIKDSMDNSRELREWKDNEKKYGFSRCDGLQPGNPKRPLYHVVLYSPRRRISRSGWVQFDWTKVGYVDEHRRIVIPLIYEIGGEFENGVAIVSKDGSKYGAIDIQGNEVIPMIYSELESIKGSTFYLAKKNGYYGVLTKEGKEIIPYKYYSIKQEGGCLIACIHKVDPYSYCYGLFSLEGTPILPAIYSEIEYAGHDFFWVSEAITHKKGLVNISGKWVIPAEYEDVRMYYKKERLYIVRKDLKWGCIDIDNNIVVPFLYDDCPTIWKRGNVVFAKCKLNGKYGFIEAQGGHIIVHIPFENKDREKVRKKAIRLMKSRGLY